MVRRDHGHCDRGRLAWSTMLPSFVIFLPNIFLFEVESEVVLIS